MGVNSNIKELFEKYASGTASSEEVKQLFQLIRGENFDEQVKSALLEKFQSEIKNKLEDGILSIENNHLKIPEKHWFLADGIAADLFLM